MVVRPAIVARALSDRFPRRDKEASHVRAAGHCGPGAPATLSGIIGAPPSAGRRACV
ncbi:MAG: hypothetical protein OXF51_09735 [Alphaproteobacteria bacterium]|nr:hypothetical protein [Alphaproteobacteria bacterium]